MPSPAARRTQLGERAIDINGLRSRYIDVRPEHETALPLLLIHGHASRIEEYETLVPHLSNGRRVIVADLPGCGFADKPTDEPYTLQRYEDFLLGLLDQLKIERATLAGGSLGGNLTLRLGARDTERFARLAAWAPAGAWVPMRRWQWLARTMRLSPSLFWPAIWIQSRFWYSPSWEGRQDALDQAFRYYREVWGPGFHRMYWDVGHDQARTSLFDHVDKIVQPTWLGWGDQDHALDMGVGVRKLAELISGSELVIFQGARHSLANERTEELGRAVHGFLESAPR